MKTLIVSYSFTGNNQTLAATLSKKLNYDHIQVTESGKRSMTTIVIDLIFHRIPQTEPAVTILDDYDTLLFLGPIWMGKIATPLRAYLMHLQNTQKDYYFFSLCGGADGGNPKISKEVQRLTGTTPKVLMEFTISDLLPSSPPPTREITSHYRLSQEDSLVVAKQLISQLSFV